MLVGTVLGIDGYGYSLAPRYEFLESLRSAGIVLAADHVRQSVELLVAALDHIKFQVDTDLNFLHGLTPMKIVPAAVYRAHITARMSVTDRRHNVMPADYALVCLVYRQGGLDADRPVLLRLRMSAVPRSTPPIWWPHRRAARMWRRYGGRRPRSGPT